MCLSSVTKKRKTLKRADIRPLFGFCKDVLVVIVRRGCGLIEDPKSQILDFEGVLQGYLVKSGGLDAFICLKEASENSLS